MVKACGSGERMKAYRAQNGLTQRQLGELLGVKQTDISHVENGRREAAPEVIAALDVLIKGVDVAQGPMPPSAGRAVEVLISEMTAARQELGQPMEPEELTALTAASAGELLSQSALLREALEVQASRELLAGAKTFRRRRETAGQGGHR